MNESTAEPNKDYRFCSQCKKSKYTKDNYGLLTLYCETTRRYQPSNAEIDGCEAFDPERLEDALRNTRPYDNWIQVCKTCGITKKECDSRLAESCVFAK